ncbi:hypothetical protein [Pedobacter glucosidilyticus]|uniref:hypothetical protein n=1 Tax=Pedobacter glucosidilyticus TaxID=1122941 RepID=UPI0026EB1A3B|nr:hypothetical protein [Pedobacter glucosidilyticus]
MDFIIEVINRLRRINYVRLFTVILYFVFAIVFLAAIGVILPFIFDEVNSNNDKIKNLNQNLITYFIAILVTSSLDYIMKIIDKEVSYKKLAILITCIFNTTILILASYAIYQNNNNKYCKDIPWQIYIGIASAYLVWWTANFNSSTFNITSTLGGNPNKPLANG